MHVTTADDAHVKTLGFVYPRRARCSPRPERDIVEASKKRAHTEADVRRAKPGRADDGDPDADDTPEEDGPRPGKASVPKVPLKE